MKKIFIFVAAIFISNSAYTQNSTNSKSATKAFLSNSLNFHDIQKKFYDSYVEESSSTEKINGEKDGDYEKFKRWEWYWEQRVGKKGQFPPNNVLWTENEKYQKENSAKAYRTTATTASWGFMGPSTSLGGYAGIGRVNCIAFHPTLPNTFWVGTPAGGLWKTTDGGVTWSTNTDNLPVLGVSDIAINSTTPSIMYIATGDGDNSYSISTGTVGGDTKSVGVLKTIDGGLTWSTTGLSWGITSQKLIRRLIIDPTNPNILMAAASDGIYRTTNAGVSWTNVRSGWFMDLQFHPTNHNIIYATTYNPSGGAQIYRSTDNGLTWGNTSLTGIVRIKLAVTPAFPAVVEALCVNTSSGLQGLWYSIDNGATFYPYWTGTCSNNLLTWAYNGAGCDGQGDYDLAYAINPINASEYFLGGINTWKSSDSGVLWYLKNFWSSNPTDNPHGVTVVHADKHWLAYHPLVAGTLFECNDGGLYKTTDGGATWRDLSNGLGISQIYRIGTSATVTNNVICGLQDNGSKELSSSIWNDRTGGDGMECIIDYTNASIQYASYVNGKIYKTTNHWVSSTTIVNNGGTGINSDGKWVTPYLMHPTNHNTLIVGKSQVYQSTDAGGTWTQLGVISGSGASGNIVAMAYAPSNPLTIYVAYEYAMYKTTNGGISWTVIGTSSEVITYVAVDPTNPLHLWVTKSGYTAGSKVFSSSDGGATWINRSGTLPNVPVNCVVYQNVGCPGVYVGTDLGVYYYGWGYGLTGWIPFNTGLPNVVVNELEISYNNNKLWAATFGRGLWNTDLYIPNCNVPSGLSATAITTTSSTLNWIAAAGAISYNIQYRQVGTGTWFSTTATTTSVSITGLAPCTNYEFQVKTVCSCAIASTFTGSATFTTTALPCNIPTGLTVTSITTSSASLNWAAVSGATGYDVRYRQTGTGTWTTVSSSTPTMVISGLLECTNYEFQVQSRCSCSTISSYTGSTTFVTASPPCVDPGGLSVSSITTSTADLNWLPVPGALSYNIQYRQTGTSAWTSTTSTTNTVAISGLLPFSDYEFQVQAVCPCTTTSNFSGSGNFITAYDNSGVPNNQLSFNFEMFPNPTSGLFTLRLKNISNAEIEVSDLQGKIVLKMAIKNHSTTIDLSSQASGVYMVKISSEEYSGAQKIVLEK